KWRPEYVECLANAERVVIWADRFDKKNQGVEHAVQVARSLRGRVDSIEVVQSKKGKDAADHLAAGHGLADVVALELPAEVLSVMHDSAVDSAGWGQPIPFRTADLPEFPVGSLPPFLSAFVGAEALATQTPTALPGCLVLAACAVCVGGRFRVEVRRGWQEPTNLFVVVVLDSGNRKSAVVADVTRPILLHEKSECERLEPEILEAETRRRVLQKRTREAEKNASKAKVGEREQLEQEAIYAANELAQVHVPPRPRLFADDVTPEKLGELICDHDGRFAVLSPEGGIFDLLAGRYSASNAPNFDVFLKGHAGDPLRVDRIGRPSNRVDQPCLTVGLTVQNDVLRGLASKPGFRGRGLLARFLYTIPESPLGRRTVDAPPMPDRVREAFHRALTTMLEMPLATDERGRPTSHVLQFDEPAAKRFKAFEERIEPQLAPFGELGMITDWGSKLAGATARLCGIIHVAKHGYDVAPAHTRRIDVDTVACAIAIGEYFLAHAKAAFAEMGADPEVENARHVLAWVSRHDKMTFNEREAFQGTKGRFKKMPELRTALRLLVEHEYLRELPREDRKGPGRPKSSTYEVNPNIENTENIEERNQKCVSDSLSSPDDSPGSQSTAAPLSQYPQYPQNSSTSDDGEPAATGEADQ
ncbi:MAG: DUF3987 domain-containing protein, partial [bacterium]|nr:DUF3987 domain-containing protein [bacterium]